MDWKNNCPKWTQLEHLEMCMPLKELSKCGEKNQSMKKKMSVRSKIAKRLYAIADFIDDNRVELGQRMDYKHDSRATI